MPSNLGKMPFQQCITTLVTNTMTIVGEADTQNLRVLTLTGAVSFYPLNGVEVWAKGDPDGAYFQVPQPAFLSWGRTDAAGADINTTVNNTSFFVMLDVTGWRGVQIRVRSTAGPARVTITAGGQP